MSNTTPDTPALLALEDGTIYRGLSFGHPGTTTGEICFNTSMTGYQEILTDPSYRGQLVTLTYPEIGNYGVNPEDAESSAVHARALVIRELSPVTSNWRSQQSLPDYLKENKILGIQGIDTRALTKQLRTAGAMKACLTTELSEDEAIQAAKDAPSMAGADFVKEVTCSDIHEWTEESRQWTIPNASSGQDTTYIDLPAEKHHIVAYDFGVKHNILRRLRQHGFKVTVVPATTSAADVLALNPDGIFLSNGPGDPAALDYIHAEVKELIGKKPIFGICLGNQIIAHAYGGKTYKLKFGHRGGNQPVKTLSTGKIDITSQNHGFAVDPDSLPDHISVTHLNLSDNTVEGIESKKDKLFSVQYHPEAAPGPFDATPLFQQFADLITANK